MAIILRILGTLDIITGVLLTLFELGFVPFWLFVPFALDLVAKGIIFRRGTASAIDFGVAFYILFLPLTGVWFVSAVITVYLVQKGLVSWA